MRLQGQLKPGQRLVSREGDLWRWDGMVARAEAPRSAAQRLAQRNRLTTLEAAAVTARAEVNDLRAAHQAASEAVAAAETASRDIREALRLARIALDKARTALGEAEREESRLTVRRDALIAAAERLDRDVAETDAALAEAKRRPRRDRRTRCTGHRTHRRPRDASKKTARRWPRPAPPPRALPARRRCAADGSRRSRWSARPGTAASEAPRATSRR